MIRNLTDKKQARDIEQFLMDVYSKIPKNIKIIFIYSIICGLSTHLYMFTNKIIVEDELYNLFSKNDTTTSGRWFLSVLSSISSDYSMPWVNGIISIVAISLTICFVIRIIKLEKISSMIVAASVLVTFPAVAATLGYMFTADAYFIGLALASAAVYIIDNCKHGYIGGVILLTLSLATYQANFTFAIAIIYVILLLSLLDEKKSIKEIIKETCRYLLILCVSFIMYYLLLTIILWARGETFTSYQGVGDMLAFTPKRLIFSLAKTYRLFYRALNGKIPGLTPLNILGNKILIILIALQALLIIWKRKEKDTKLRLLLTIGMIILMPIGLVSIKLLVPPLAEVHMLMIYSIALLFVLGLRVNELYNSTSSNKGGVLIGVLTLIICIYSAYSGYIITNKSYLVMDLSYKKTYSNATRILNKIEDLEDFTTDKKVAFIGNSAYNPYFNSKMFLETRVNELHDMTGVPLTTVCRSEDSWYLFIYDYLGVSLMSPGNEKIAVIKKSEEFLDMPLYPQKGSVKMIEDIAVVKLATAAIPSHIGDVYIDDEHSNVKVNFMRYEGQIYMPIRFISQLMEASIYYENNKLYINTNTPEDKEQMVRERLYALQSIKFVSDDILVNEQILAKGVKNIDCNGDKYIPLELAKDIFNINIEYNMEDEVLFIEKNY